MSTAEHALWPPVGSKWAHWSDLLLAAQLAAARSGFTALQRYYRLDSPGQLSIRCSVLPSQARTGTCIRTVLKAESEPSKRWRVTELFLDALSAGEHSAHVGGIGTSCFLENSPVADAQLAVGDKVGGYRELHTLEAALRVHARVQGRYIQTQAVPDRSGGGRYSYTVSCVLGIRECNFLIKLKQCDPLPTGEPVWTCRRLEFFPAARLLDGCIGRPIRSGNRRSSGTFAPPSLIEQELGSWPVKSALPRVPHAVEARPPETPKRSPSLRSPAPSPGPSSAARQGKAPRPRSSSPAAPPPSSKRRRVSPARSSRSPPPSRASASGTPEPPAPPAPPPPPPPVPLAELVAALSSATTALSAAEDAAVPLRAGVEALRAQLDEAEGELREAEERIGRRRRRVRVRLKKMQRAVKAGDAGGTAQEKLERRRKEKGKQRALSPR
ncbi:hypothetical protein JCM10450v2_004607 [Rhodotorula kratochvilovae]